jgi:hypothetical protein
MRKLLSVLLFAAAMCAPSYGDILVYKFTCSLNPWIGFLEDDYEAATVISQKNTGYIVFDVNTETWELNSTPTFIFYEGKSVNYKRYYWVDANESETDFYLFDVEGTKGITGRGVYGYVTLDAEIIGYWYSPIYGKCVLVDIGRADKRKVRIPKSSKGVVTVLDDYSIAPISAFGNVVLALDAKYTIYANKIASSKAATFAKIIADLQANGYELDF